MQGQVPAAAAADRLFPAVFGKLNKRGAPVLSLLISSALISVLLFMNFSRSLADTYQFIILISTMTVLVAFLFSSIAYLILAARSRDSRWRQPWKLGLAVIAFSYSLWAVAGSGQEAVYWGFLLLIAGVPLYGFSKIARMS
jgi:APA family basic amino acid/polyamine antiporter